MEVAEGEPLYEVVLTKGGFSSRLRMYGFGLEDLAKICDEYKDFQKIYSQVDDRFDGVKVIVRSRMSRDDFRKSIRKSVDSAQYEDVGYRSKASECENLLMRTVRSRSGYEELKKVLIP